METVRATRSGSIEIRVLGSFRVSVIGGTAIVLPVGAQHLVALLALRGRAGRRRLAGTLWPDASEERSLASLRTCLWRVHQVLPGLVDATASDMGLGLDPEIDVAQLLEAARSDFDPARAVSAVHVALSAGEVLPDWDDLWLAEEREHLRQVRLHLLESGARMLAQDGRYGLAIEAALAALSADDLRESAHRTVIAVHLAEGNLAEARRAFDSCRRTLREALGVEPTPATATLVGV